MLAARALCAGSLRRPTAARGSAWVAAPLRAAPHAVASSPERGPPAVIPHFRVSEDAVPASAFTIDCSSYGPRAEPCAELAARMRDTYAEHGVVLLRNTGLTDITHMKNHAGTLVQQEMKYEGGANPREGILGNVYEVGAPHDAWLHYHHEMAYNQFSMRNVAFLSLKAAAPGRGDSYLSENVRVTDELLDSKFGRKLKEKGVCYIRCLTDAEAYSGEGWKHGQPVYNHWQLSMGATTPEEAEEKAGACGLSVEWCTDPLKEDSHRYMRTSIHADAFEYCPELQRNVLYSSIADHNMWFDTWQGVSSVPPAKRPLQMTFGDGEPFTVEELRYWVAAYDRGGIRVQWQVGDILVFCNLRFAHDCRPAFELRPGEERQLGVVLGERFERLGALPGAW